jgi:hypothetical protein
MIEFDINLRSFISKMGRKFWQFKKSSYLCNAEREKRFPTAGASREALQKRLMAI